MYRLLNCLATQHDYRLVLLAAVVCAATIVAAFKTFSHAQERSDAKRPIWLLITGFCAATGIWATHFVAMLAYESGVATTYGMGLTVTSFIVAFVMTTLGFSLSAQGTRTSAIAGGAVIGLAIAAMHFTGMAALVVGGKIHWDLPHVTASLIVGIALTSVAMLAHRQPDRTRALWSATALLILGICGLHFTAMAAVTIEPDPTIVVQSSGIDRMLLAVGIASITMLVLVAGGVSMFIERLKSEVARQVLELQRADADTSSARAEAQARAEAESRRVELRREAEWAFQEELAKLVEGAATGDFSRRVDLAGKSGLTSKLGSGLNSWADGISGVFVQVGKVMSALADGDFTERIDGDYEGELLRLKSDVNRMGIAMQAMAVRISEATESVEVATREITMGVEDLASRTEQQAATLEEATASLEQLSAAVGQNAGNAQAVNQAAAQARELAVGGSAIAGQAITAMGRIEDSSRQISEIVALIEEIAFQTNILALNAAVEAARAGEAGRGFAVVANEVRALSQRSSQALKDIKIQIGGSNFNVSEGVALVTKANASLGEIVDSIKQVADLVSEIATASQEQSAGINQVNRAVASLDQMTQQNSALVEETSVALRSAQSQVEHLRGAVAHFKTGAERTTATPSTQRHTPTHGAAAAQSAAGMKAPSVAVNPALRQKAILAHQIAVRRAKGAASPAPSHDDAAWKQF